MGIKYWANSLYILTNVWVLCTKLMQSWVIANGPFYDYYDKLISLQSERGLALIWVGSSSVVSFWSIVSFNGTCLYQRRKLKPYNNWNDIIQGIASLLCQKICHFILSFMTIAVPRLDNLFNILMMLNKCIIRWYRVDVTSKARSSLHFIVCNSHF